MQDLPAQQNPNLTPLQPIPNGAMSKNYLVIASVILIIVALIVVIYVIYIVNGSKTPTTTTTSNTTTLTSTPTPTPTPDLSTWTGTAVALQSTVTNNVRSNFADAAIYTMPSGGYRLYFQEFNGKPNDYGSTDSTQNIESATSTDGLTWSMDSGTRISNCIPYKQHVEVASDGKLRLYTSCGVYESSDGLTWIKFGTASIPNPTGTSGMGPAVVIKLSDGSYKAYRPFDFGGASNPAQGTVKVYSYTSNDGITFTMNQTPILSGCISNSSDSYNLRDALMVEQNTDGTYTMYLSTEGNCPTHTTPSQPANSSAMPPVSGTLAPITTLQPVDLVATSTDGSSFTVKAATEIIGGEPYLTIKNSGKTTLIYGYCYNPLSPAVPGESTWPALNTKYPGCSIYEATL